MGWFRDHIRRVFGQRPRLHRERPEQRPLPEGTLVDLGLVSFSPGVAERWDAVVRLALERMDWRGLWLDPEDLGQEQGLLLPDGRLLIYLSVPGYGHITLPVEPSQWSNQAPAPRGAFYAQGGARPDCCS